MSTNENNKEEAPVAPLSREEHAELEEFLFDDTPLGPLLTLTRREVFTVDRKERWRGEDAMGLEGEAPEGIIISGPRVNGRLCLCIHPELTDEELIFLRETLEERILWRKGLVKRR
jgi:hypothetical protein